MMLLISIFILGVTLIITVSIVFIIYTSVKDHQTNTCSIRKEIIYVNDNNSRDLSTLLQPFDCTSEDERNVFTNIYIRDVTEPTIMIGLHSRITDFLSIRFFFIKEAVMILQLFNLDFISIIKNMLFIVTFP